IIFLWTGIEPFAVPSADELIAYQLPAFIAMTAVLHHFAPKSYLPILSTAVSLFNSLRLVPTVVASLIKPFGAPFRVTAKGRDAAEGQGDRFVLAGLAILAALTLGGLAVNRLSPRGWATGESLVVAEVYALFNLVLLALAALMALEEPRLRQAQRF